MCNYKHLRAYDANGDLTKSWFISFFFRDPQSGVFKRFRETVDINRIHILKDRKEALYALLSAKEAMLKNGWSPYITYEPQKFMETAELMFMTIDEAIDKVLDHKRLHLKPTSYSNFSNRIDAFKKFLDKHRVIQVNVKDITKKYVLEYLDLKSLNDKISNRTRNNILIDLKSMFSTMLDMEIIENNQAATIKKMATESEKNALYSQDQLKNIFDHLEKNDPYLMVYCKFIAYTFIRPIELTRLRVGDIDMVNKVINLSAHQTKNKTIASLPIMDIIYPDILALNLEQYPPDYFLFSSKLKPHPIPTTRDFFTNRFSKVKKELKLSDNHTMYGLKHTFVSDLVRNGAPELDVRRLTRHKTSDAFHAYIRELNIERPMDLSRYFSRKY